MFLHSNHPHNRHLQKIVCLDTAELSQRPDNLDAALERLHLNCRATTLALAAALEAKDPETRHHSERVVAYCLCLGRALKLSGSEMVTLEQGALLHDIGKIGVRDAVLLKRGALTDEEWTHMRRHVEFGARILSGIAFLKDASQIVAQHHERFDGSGYPDGIAGESICLGARIFAVADAVDAITSNRPYRKARPFEQAAEELTRGSGTQFDPAVVRAFIEVPFDTWRERRYAVAEADRARHNARGEFFHSFALGTDTSLCCWPEQLIAGRARQMSRILRQGIDQYLLGQSAMHSQFDRMGIVVTIGESDSGKPDLFETGQRSFDCLHEWFFKRTAG